MKRVLALQHVWECPTGALGEILQEHGIDCDTVNVEEEALPDPGVYDAIIAFGGSQHVYQEEKHPYFMQEKGLIRSAVEQDIPYLGICLGGQLHGRKDPLFAGLPGYQKVFHWHEDAFDIPAGGILLATSETTENQAFRYGRCAYGLQYHIELNPDLLDLWLGHPEFKQSIIDIVGIDAYSNIERERHTHYVTYREHTRIMFENFLRIGRLI